MYMWGMSNMLINVQIKHCTYVTIAQSAQVVEYADASIQRSKTFTHTNEYPGYDTKTFDGNWLSFMAY